MSTSANLPAGATLLSISGKRCTAIPRTDSAFLNSILATALVPSSLFLPPATTTAPAVTTTPPAVVAATSAAPQVAATSAPPASAVDPAPAIAAAPPATTSTTTPILPTSNTPTTIVVASASPTPLPDTSTSTPSIAPVPVTTPTASPEPSSVPISSSTPLPSDVLSSTIAADLQTSVSNTPVIVAPTSSTETTAAKTTSSTSSTSALAAQSELSTGPTSANDDINSGAKATTTSSSATLATSSVGAQSITAATTTSSGSKVSMPMVGGILGGIAFIGIVSFLLWFLRRRRRQRDSFLTPLGSDPGDHSRSTSASSKRQPITPLEKIRSQVESKFAVVAGSLTGSVAGLKSRIKGARSGKGVNMDRGNSQFMERIPQHSRQNSALSGQQAQTSTKERFLDWFDRIKEDYLFRLRVKRPRKEFSVTREKQGHAPSSSTSSTAPDFSQLLAMEERELHIESERRRQSLAIGTPGFGKFDNPFSDAPLRVLNPDLAPANPFADSAAVISTPQVSQPPASGYVTDVRRSRGQSISVPSRYASTYAPDRDTYGYRDTYMTSATNGRKTKGRSDPFDLDSLQFESSSQSMPTNNNSLYMNGYNQASADEMNTRIVSQASSAGTYSSKYSSQALSGNWGGPGPDLGSTPNLNSESYLQDTLKRNGSNGSGKSVGKAM